MDDRYLFRAKRTDNGEWVEGALFDGKEHCIIGQKIKFSPYVSLECKITGYEVDPSTICQCTGLTDKNGKKIFEGDIVRYGEICGEVKFGLHESNWQICKYNQGFYIEFPEEGLYRKELGYYENKVVVIGNIYDSPKLLEDEENKHGKDI